MSVAQKPNIGRSRESRVQMCATEIAMEAIAQAQRRTEHERELMRFIVTLAKEGLNQDQRRALAVEALKRGETHVNELLRHIDELRALAGQYESLVAA